MEKEKEIEYVLFFRYNENIMTKNEIENFAEKLKSDYLFRKRYNEYLRKEKNIKKHVLKEKKKSVKRLKSRK